MNQIRNALTVILCVLASVPALAQPHRPLGGGVLYGPVTITEPGDYYATGDIKGPIVIAADDVQIDLGGFNLIAAEVDYWNGNAYLWPIEAFVAESVDNVTIENGTITLADPAIDFADVIGFTISEISFPAHSDVRIQGSIGTFANNTIRNRWSVRERPPDERQGTRWIQIEADFVEVRDNIFPDFYDGGGLHVAGAFNSVTGNVIEFAPHCYGGCLGVRGDYNTVERNSIRHGGDSGTALSVAGHSNRVRDNVIVGGGDEVGGGAFGVYGNSNIIEGNRVSVRLSWYFPFVLRGNHNFLRENSVSNSTEWFYLDCPSDPGNWAFCDFGEDNYSGGGNFLPDPM